MSAATTTKTVRAVAATRAASRSSRLTAAGVFVTIGLVTYVSAAAQTVTVKAETLEQLQQIIKQQQQQLERQSATIGALENRLDRLEQTSTETKTIATDARTTAAEAMASAKEPTGGGRERLIGATQDKVKLSISGQINQAINVVDDGNNTDAFFVDNDVSNSRLRILGTAQLTEDTLVGSNFETAFSPNNSYDVSQGNESTDDFIDVRRVEGYVRNRKYGQIMLGKGQATADDTAEYDLSLVAGPIMYSGVADIVGGMQFTRKRDGRLSSIAVGDAFFNFDGNRQNRVRYDSPLFGPGVQVSASYGSDDRYDGAILWGADYGDWSGIEIGNFLTLGAISIREPSADDVDYRMAGAFSALHQPSGVSVTVSGGFDELNGGDDNPYNLYVKLAWDTRFTKIGPTGFGVDYTYTENVSGDGDDGTVFGFAAVQLIDRFGAELYAQFRVFDLDVASGGSVDDLVVGTFGARIKF